MVLVFFRRDHDRLEFTQVKLVPLGFQMSCRQDWELQECHVVYMRDVTGVGQVVLWYAMKY